MEGEIKEVLKEYLDNKDLNIVLYKLLQIINSNENKLELCSNCDNMVEMISGKEICPVCFC